MAVNSIRPLLEAMASDASFPPGSAKAILGTARITTNACGR